MFESLWLSEDTSGGSVRHKQVGHDLTDAKILNFGHINQFKVGGSKLVVDMLSSWLEESRSDDGSV